MFYNLFEAHDQVSHKLVLTTKIKKETKQNNLEKGVFLIFELAKKWYISWKMVY